MMSEPKTSQQMLAELFEDAMFRFHEKLMSSTRGRPEAEFIINGLLDAGFSVVPTGLLHRIDGQLGLAVHRGEGKEQRWRDEASELITEIRRYLTS